MQNIIAIGMFIGVLQPLFTVPSIAQHDIQERYIFRTTGTREFVLVPSILFKPVFLAHALLDN